MRDAPNHKQQVGFRIGREAHGRKVGAGNRWDSGSPFELGGLAPINGFVFTQQDTDPPIKDVFLVMKVLQRQARQAAGLPSVAPRTYEPEFMGPVS